MLQVILLQLLEKSEEDQQLTGAHVYQPAVEVMSQTGLVAA
jgi:hypothetical protein